MEPGLDNRGALHDLQVESKGEGEGPQKEVPQKSLGTVACEREDVLQISRHRTSHMVFSRLVKACNQGLEVFSYLVSKGSGSPVEITISAPCSDYK